MRSTAVLSFLLAVLPVPAVAGFWDTDVWKADDRPFLFYGTGEVPRNPDAILSKLPTPEALQAERQRRLSRAVMDPTPENVASYLEANAFVLEKSGKFSQAWREALWAWPEYDETTRHTAVNSASVTLSQEAARKNEALVRMASKDFGLIVFLDSSRSSQLMAPLVDRFAALHGWELVHVAVGVDAKTLGADVRPDRGLSTRTTSRGLRQFPAVVLVSRADRDPRQARLLATGIVDVTELTRRAAALVRRDLAERTRSVPIPSGIEADTPLPVDTGPESPADFLSRRVGISSAFP